MKHLGNCGNAASLDPPDGEAVSTTMFMRAWKEILGIHGSLSKWVKSLRPSSKDKKVNVAECELMNGFHKYDIFLPMKQPQSKTDYVPYQIIIKICPWIITQLVTRKYLMTHQVLGELIICVTMTESQLRYSWHRVRVPSKLTHGNQDLNSAGHLEKHEKFRSHLNFQASR